VVGIATAVVARRVFRAKRPSLVTIGLVSALVHAALDSPVANALDRVRSSLRESARHAD
jgi:hypothetical protein